MARSELPSLLSSLIREPLLGRLAECEQREVLERPLAGDVLVCSVEDAEGPYADLEVAPLGHPVRLEIGDRFIGVLGRRESAVNITGDLPTGNLVRGDRINLVAIAGLVAVAEYVPRVPNGRARLLQFEASLCDRAGPVNVRRFPALTGEVSPAEAQHLFWIVVCGTSAEVGKSTAAERIISRASASGAIVAGVKLAGTGRLKDPRRLAAAGASWVADFTDAGFETTYGMSVAEAGLIFNRISAAVLSSGIQVVVAELGGDLMEAGVPLLLPRLGSADSHFVLVASDAMAAANALTRFPIDARVSVLCRDSNVRAIERRLHIGRVYDINRPQDLIELVDNLLQKRAVR